MIKLLDCTLRDGGYINDWNFGKQAIWDIKENLEISGVDIIELGFMRHEPKNEERTIFSNIESVKQLIGHKIPNREYAVMAEVSNPYPLEKLEPYSQGAPDIIRVIVWKRMLKEGFEYCKGIVEKGYKLCVQPARVSQYSDHEFIDMIKMFNELNPMAIYVVDSWGTMYKDELLHYLKLADEHLKKGISVGYHGHNNMMQAFDVAQAFCEQNLNRDLIIDASIYGIGRGAGNLNTEIFAKWANEKLDKNYDTIPLIKIYDKYIKHIYNHCEKWGFSIPYLITAKYNANPNFARYLEKKGLSCEIMEKCMAAIPSQERIIFKPEIADKYIDTIKPHINSLLNIFKTKYNNCQPHTRITKYCGYNYENYENRFELTEHIKSNVLFGSQDKISDPFITVVIPTYKRLNLFKEALQSVLNQQKVNFNWNIIIMDNEPYEGKPNETQDYIKSLSNEQITYYRNDKNLRPGDNFNRGIYLAKAPWIMMLHDDDILLPNALKKMGNLIKYLSTLQGKPLGAIASAAIQFKYDEKMPYSHKHLLEYLSEKLLLSTVNDYSLFKLTHSNIMFTGHIGGSVPSNGAIFNKEAVIKAGGFNEDAGISADLILYYCMENNYSVYQLLDATGFYRWGINQMTQFENTLKTVKDNNDFREYVFNKNCFNRIWGRLFRNSLYYNFTKCVIEMRKVVTFDHCRYEDFWEIHNNKPNCIVYMFYKYLIRNVYNNFKKLENINLQKDIKKFLKLQDIKK